MNINGTVPNNRTPRRDYDYVELPRRPPPSQAERFRLYRETRAALRRRILESLGHLSAAKKSYDAISERSSSAKARNLSRKIWITLRAKNGVLHESATKNAPARMVANMLDNWPAWYPQHLKPSAEDAAKDIESRANALKPIR
jgi:hypothetical protein